MSDIDITNRGENAKAMKGWNDWLSAWLGAVGRAWTDAPFKGRLLADARAALKELDYEVPAVLEIKVIEILNRHDAHLVPVSDHSPYVFTPGIVMPKQTLVIGLLPPPENLADGLITLASHTGLSTSQCFCGCS